MKCNLFWLNLHTCDNMWYTNDTKSYTTLGNNLGKSWNTHGFGCHPSVWSMALAWFLPASVCSVAVAVAGQAQGLCFLPNLVRDWMILGGMGLIHREWAILVVEALPWKILDSTCQCNRQEKRRPPAAAAPFGFYKIGMFSVGFSEALTPAINMTLFSVNQPCALQFSPLQSGLFIRLGGVLSYLQLPGWNCDKLFSKIIFVYSNISAYDQWPVAPTREQSYPQTSI